MCGAGLREFALLSIDRTLDAVIVEDEEDESGESFELDLLSSVAATRAMAGDRIEGGADGGNEGGRGW